MDLFLDDVLEQNNIHFNDGFSGRMNPMFSTSNYNKNTYQTSAHYSNTSEVSTFNLFKLHGSVNWKKDKDKIYYDNGLKTLIDLQDLPQDEIIEISNDDNYSTVKEKLNNTDGSNVNYKNFIEKYNEFVFVNPTKEKFQLTTIDYVFYEQLRIFSNTLEKENSVLFVHGFSFADEHIQEITVRAVKSNPTLILYVFCFNADQEKSMKNIFSNCDNVELISINEDFTFKMQVEKYFSFIAKEFKDEFWVSKKKEKGNEVQTIEVTTENGE